MNEPRTSKQYEVYYSGRVQGVGFRANARHISRRYEVTGFVRNLPDGRVHLLAEGQQEHVEQFLAECHRCEQLRQVRCHGHSA